jgi:hypothetical protein
MGYSFAGVSASGTTYCICLLCVGMRACRAGRCWKSIHRLTVHDVNIRADNGLVTLMPTVLFRAPLDHDDAPSEAAFLYAWAVLVLEVYLAKPTDNMSDEELHLALEQEQVHPAARALFQLCLERNEANALLLDKLLDHPWLNTRSCYSCLGSRAQRHLRAQRPPRFPLPSSPNVVNSCSHFLACTGPTLSVWRSAVHV